MSLSESDQSERMGDTPVNASPSAAPDARIPPAGVIGRVGKLAVGAFQLSFAYSVASQVASIMRAPPHSAVFWAMVAAAVWLIPMVANLGLLRERALGSRPRWWVVAAFLVVAGTGWVVSRTLWSPPAAAFTIAVVVLVHGYVGVCHIASAALGFPGCELRALAYLVGRARRAEFAFAPCPGIWTPLDRWEARVRRRS